MNAKRATRIGSAHKRSGLAIFCLSRMLSTLNPVKGRGRVAQLYAALRPQPSTLNFPLDLASVCLDEKDLLGSYSSDFTLQAEVARLVFSRQLDVRPLISHRFPLHQTAEAVALAACPTSNSLKILVTS